jgi:hypothetical protein
MVLVKEFLFEYIKSKSVKYAKVSWSHEDSVRFSEPYSSEDDIAVMFYNLKDAINYVGNMQDLSDSLKGFGLHEVAVDTLEILSVNVTEVYITFLVKTGDSTAHIEVNVDDDEYYIAHLAIDVNKEPENTLEANNNENDSVSVKDDIVSDLGEKAGIIYDLAVSLTKNTVLSKINWKVKSDGERYASMKVGEKSFIVNVSCQPNGDKPIYRASLESINITEEDSEKKTGRVDKCLAAYTATTLKNSTDFVHWSSVEMLRVIRDLYETIELYHDDNITSIKEALKAAEAGKLS